MAQNDGSADFERIKKLINKRTNFLLEAFAEEVLKSIRDGSSITASPGLPEVTGRLYRSWKKRKISANLIRVASTMFYAPWIEEGKLPKKGTVLRTLSHAVKLTRVNAQKLLEYTIRKNVNLDPRREARG